MAVDFLSDEQVAGFGGFPDEVPAEDLERFCWLDDADLSVVGRRRGMHNRLGFAVQLITVRVAGRFLTDRSAGQMLGSLGRMLKCHATVGRLADGIALEVDCREGKVAR